MIGFKSKGIPLLHVLLIYVLVILTTTVNGQNASTLSPVTSTNASNTTHSPTTPKAATSNTSDTHRSTSSSSGSSPSEAAVTTTTPAPATKPNTTVSSTQEQTTPRATTAQPNASSTQSTSDTTIAKTVAPTHTPPTSKTNGTSGSSPATDAPTNSSSADTTTPVSSSSTPKPTTTTLAPSSGSPSSASGKSSSTAPQPTITNSTTNVSSTPSSGTTKQNSPTASISTTNVSSTPSSGTTKQNSLTASISTTTTMPTTPQEPTTTVTNYCINVTCSNGGTCKTAADNYTCECMPGYTGRHCDENKDDCASNPCKNGSTCADLVNGYNCSCVPGFSGKDCDEDIDECASSPCENGTCNNLVNNYTCDCTPGYTGYNCEIDINECDSSPCISGTCNNLVNNYTCDCTPGYTGYNCENDINECDSSPCINGTCNNLVNNYTCDCTPGFDGYNCENDIDDCEGIVCANDGRCEDLVNNYKCNCTSAWKGLNCTEDVNECDEGTHECHVLANCSNTEGSYNCTCKQGFVGDGRNCIDINECETNDSQCNASNTEVCFNTAGSYKCYCKPGWTGLYCDTDINECNDGSANCDGNADCSNTDGGYTCTCRVGYRGNGTKCTEIVLFAIPGGENHQGDGNIYGPYKVPGGFPYHQKMYYDIYVSINGYLTLGESYTQTYPPHNSTAWAQTGLPIIAPLWADIELKNPSNLTVNKAVTNVAVLEMLVSDSEESLANPRFGFIATWNKAVPYPYDQNWQYEEADFQVAIVTNGSSTLLIFNYDQEYFTWQSNYHDRFVSIGFSEENLSGRVFFDSNTFTNANKNGTNTISEMKGRWVFSVSTPNATTESESKCQAWLDDQPLQDMISTALNDSDPCPCSLSQAERDRRFKLGSSPGTSTEYSHVYTSRFPRPTSHSIQQCHYNTNQGLVRGYPGGGFMVSKTDSELGINEAYGYCCSDSTRLCGMFYSKVPSDTCSGYTPPTWLPSWGDPHITTLDAVQYTFNGRGEYVFLKTDNTMVQVRTDLASEGDTDATVFVGLAAKIGDSEKIEIHLNRATKTCDVYVNGTKQSGVLDISTEMMTVEGKGTDNNPIYLTLSSGIAVKITASSILDLVISVFGDIHGKIEGLLGNHDGDKANDFVCRNGTLLPADSTEEQLYDFGTSWMVYSNESLFNYTLTGGNYNFYNNQTVRPSVFIGDHVKNLSGLITRKCMGQFNESMVNGTCGNNSACIIDALATCNLTIGEQTKHTQQQEALNREIIGNHPPVFRMNETLYVGPDVTALFQLSLSVTDDNDFKTTVDSNIAKFTFNDTSKAFTWNITEDLKTRNVYLRFEAIDELNASSIYWPNIYYCGCAHKDQCYYSSLMETQSSAERFYRAKCNCNSTTKGEYCDQTVDVCSSNPCFGKCNSTSTSICEPCPSGYNGTANGTKCYDIDECRLETDACEQDCINTAGSYECNCTLGYKLNQNNHTCDDIDECALPTNNDCQDNQICTNIPGSYECNCMPGFVDMGNNNCQIVRYSFVVKLKITITQIPNITPGDEDIKKKIANWLNTTVFKTYTFTSIKIIFSSPATSRLRRDAGTTERVLDVTGVMQTDISTYTTDGIDKAFNKYKTDTGLVNEQLGDMPVKVDLSASRVPEDSEGAVCSIPGFAKCDPISTVCQVTNGHVKCSCREGFDGWLVSGIICKDINECDADPSICVGGINCTNQPGSFICTCDNGFKFDDVSTCIDMCSSNPCQNGGECTHGSQEGQYVCKCDDKWAGMNCERENEETSRLTTIIIIVGAVVGGICLILLIALFGVYRRMRSKQFGYSRYAGLSNLTDDNAYSMPRAKLSQDKDTPFDDTSTTFSIPRPKLTNTSHEMTDLDAISNNSNNERYAKDEGKDEERNPLASTSASTRDDNSSGRANPSFLHDETTSQRNSKIGSKPSNHYEYF